METQEIITTLAAVIGILLGIYNFIHARSAERVRLRIIPKATSFKGSDHNGRDVYIHNRDRYDPSNLKAPAETLSLEVINLSAFPVTIDEVGLMSFWSRNRMALITPIIKDGKPWPRELKPRENVVVEFNAPRLLSLERIGKIRKAYATTICGSTCYGTSGALREFVRIARGA